MEREKRDCVCAMQLLYSDHVVRRNHQHHRHCKIMNIRFEWDIKKAVANQRKHRIRFEEAIEVFWDALAVIFDDELHSEDEEREIIIGQTKQGRLLLVAFTERNGVIRLISARQTTFSELQKHESRNTMKEPTPTYTVERPDELQDEYDFDYSKGRPNRFAEQLKDSTVLVSLEPDVAAVFTTSESVNQMLRALIAAMPATT